MYRGLDNYGAQLAVLNLSRVACDINSPVSLRVWDYFYLQFRIWLRIGAIGYRFAVVNTFLTGDGYCWKNRLIRCFTI